MDVKTVNGWKRRKSLAFLALGFLAALLSPAFAKYEREAMQLESELQSRIENILGKTLPANSYIVTVKVEMSEPAQNSTVRTQSSQRSASNPFLSQSKFMLPGVPQKKEFVQAPGAETSETTVNTFNPDTLVRRITISILVAPDVSTEQIRALRDFIGASVPFNPLRGDEMDIQRSTLLKRINQPPSQVAPPVNTAAANTVTPVDDRSPRNKSVWSGLNDRSTQMLLVFLGAVIIALTILIVFLFGPMRAFLNRLLTVLPRVGEQAAYTVSNAPAKAAPVIPNAFGGMDRPNLGNASLRRGGAHGNEIPFHFIREEQIAKLPMLIKQMDPSHAAIVLAYLPPEWASRVFGALELPYQTGLVRELSESREVPAEVVKEVEAQVKAKLPYFVGGRDWIQSVYQMTQPQTQRAILGTLNQQSPELAKALRRKTFFFEDLSVLPIAGLRLLMQEAGFPTMAQALRDEKPEMRDGVVRRMPPAMREILEQELELGADDKSASAEAKSKIVSLARQMMLDGRIAFGDKGDKK